MFSKSTVLGIGIFFIAALVSAGFMSTNAQNTQQAIAKSPTSMKSLMGGNNTMLKLGVISMPIVCTTLNDVLNSTLSGVFGRDGMAIDAGNNETNSTQGMMMDLMKQGMDNLTQGKLQQLKDFVFCSPASEKMVKNMMK
jgi:flagellar capping protein FliD